MSFKRGSTTELTWFLPVGSHHYEADEADECEEEGNPAHRVGPAGLEERVLVKLLAVATQPNEHEETCVILVGSKKKHQLFILSYPSQGSF